MDSKRFQQILVLEQSKGYTDTVVSGGMDKLLKRYSSQFSKQIRLPLPSYSELNPAQREEWVKSTLESFSAPDKSIPVKSRKSERVLDFPVSKLKGINTKLLGRFDKLGVTTIRDLLCFFPRRHIDYSSPTPIYKLEPGEDCTVLVQVWEASKRKTRRMDVVEVVVGDKSGVMTVSFFNQPYLLNQFTPKTRIIISGKAGIYKGRRTFLPSSYEILGKDDTFHSGFLIPVYSLTEGLFPRQVRRLVKQALDTYLSQVKDFLPNQIKKNAHLIDLQDAIKKAHYPPDEAAQLQARRRLAFDELFLIQIGVLSRRRRRQEGVQGIQLATNPEHVSQFISGLSFELTGAQKQSLKEVIEDLSGSKPMSRLLHGDVGSGKTVVATAAMITVVGGDAQAALMAPTEILAEQHFNSICSLLGDTEGEGIIRTFASVLDRPLTVGLLTGSIRQKGKKELQHKVSEGEIDILIGTQALIQKNVEFRRLGLVVVDEQHRFGVMQRLILAQKGKGVHMLAMSATPIPRTLALTLYGDMDISLIDELPPGRQPIQTKWLEPRRRQGGYKFIKKEINEGRQAYIICPLVEESEASEAKAATVEYERLSHEVFPDLKLGLLHGRMSAKAKDEVMERFRDGVIDILVSTSVVEVGVDVPNATVMLVEGADRFGLSQLHQFRGRVWRSSHQAYCMLLADHPTEDGRERLRTMESTHNGFVLAEKDLEMRGPGEFFGTRQSGLPDLKMARLTDVKLLELARREAEKLFEIDPELNKPEHRALSAEVKRMWDRSS